MSYSINLSNSNDVNQPDYFDIPDIPNTNGGWPNITYNLAAFFATLPCNRPTTWTNKQAKDLIQPLAKSIKLVTNHPDQYVQYNAPNGWGNIENGNEFLTECLILFTLYPDKYIICD